MATSKENAEQQGTGCVLVGVFALILVVVFSCSGEDEPPTPQEQAADRERNLRYDALDTLERGMRDPDSMETRDVRVAHPGIGGSPIVCGEVNGRNGFGGMTGYQRFMVIGPVPMIDQDGSSDFAKLWRDAGC